MKKFTLAAFAAVVALGANAQFNAASPYVNASVTEGQQIFDVFAMGDAAFNTLSAKAGKTVNDFRVNDTDIFFYVWEDTFTGGDSSSYPGVGYDGLSSDGYTALTVGTKGWSGGGYCVEANRPSINLSHLNDDTRFHVAYMSMGTAPESIFFGVGNENFGKQGKICVGSVFVDGSTATPVAGEKSKDDWQALDIKFSDIKKLWPDFVYPNSPVFKGNIVTVLGGGTPGRNISLDAIYFYTPASGDSAVEGVAEEANFVVTAETVNSSVAGIQVYNLEGKLVKASDATVLGISDLAKGVYVVKSGKSVKKILK